VVRIIFYLDGDGLNRLSLDCDNLWSLMFGASVVNYKIHCYFVIPKQGIF
jgi:hypothetical protein